MERSAVWLGILGASLLNVAAAGLGSIAHASNCQVDMDCPRGNTCELQSYTTCQGADPACKPGAACGDKPSSPEQPGCAPYVEGICRQSYELPCQRDADCGAGFRCAEQISVSCMGMGSTGNGSTPPEFHEVCHETRGTFACQLNQTACNSDADCGAGLSCQLADEVTVCGAPIRPGVYDAGSDPCSLSAAKLCAPAGYFSSKEDRASVDGGAVTHVESVDDTLRSDAGAGGAPPVTGSEPDSKADDGCSLARAGHAGADLTGLAIITMLGVLTRRRRLLRRG